VELRSRASPSDNQKNTFKVTFKGYTVKKLHWSSMIRLWVHGVIGIAEEVAQYLIEKGLSRTEAKMTPASWQQAMTARISSWRPPYCGGGVLPIVKFLPSRLAGSTSALVCRGKPGGSAFAA
jgi:hypothetical protein